MAGFAAAMAFLGWAFVPHDPNGLIGFPFGGPTWSSPLGFDYVGRDVLSRLLVGGRTSILIAVVGTAVGEAIGVAVGIYSAYRRGWVDAVIGRTTDLVLGFPALVLSLLLLATFGTSMVLVVVALIVTTAPGAARVARAAAMSHVTAPYVEAAVMRGESVRWILLGEVTPNLRQLILVDVGFRLTTSLVLVAALSFVGLGLQPPASDWGLMIGENRLGLSLQPLAVLAPSIAVVMLTVGINLMLDQARFATDAATGDAEASAHV